MKTIYLTRHARNRMRLYQITFEEVTKVLGQPSFVQPAEHGKRHAWGQTERGRILRVTFKEESDRCVIITVTPKRRIEEKSHEN